MKIASLIICFSLVFLLLQANEIPKDSLFQQAFRMRYENPVEGIKLARELIDADAPSAWLAIVYSCESVPPIPVESVPLSPWWICCSNLQFIFDFSPSE